MRIPENTTKGIIPYNADSLEYAGRIRVTGASWEFIETMKNEILEMMRGMPLKAMLSSLIYCNISMIWKNNSSGDL
jgi:hypothetical protein